MSRNKRIFYFAAGFGMALAAYLAWRAWRNRDTRPTLEDAEATFKDIYPGVKIVNLKITVDEIYARNFLFQYQKPGSENGRSIEIQFMRDPDTRDWVPTPKPPVELR